MHSSKSGKKILFVFSLRGQTDNPDRCDLLQQDQEDPLFSMGLVGYTVDRPVPECLSYTVNGIDVIHTSDDLC